MSKKILQILSIVLIIFVVSALVLVLLLIWGAVDVEMVKDTFIKLTYTLGAILVASILVSLVSELMGNRIKGDTKNKPLSFHND